MIKRFADQSSAAESQMQASMFKFSVSWLRRKTGTQAIDNSDSYKISVQSNIGWRNCPVANKSFENNAKHWSFLADNIKPKFLTLQICV